MVDSHTVNADHRHRLSAHGASVTAQTLAVRHHIDDADLLAYASGSTSELLSLLIATHLTLCKQCRETVSLLEAVGGRIFDDAVDADIASPDDATSVVAAMVQSLETIASTDQQSDAGGVAGDVLDAAGRSRIADPNGDVRAALDGQSMQLDIDDFPLVLQSYMRRNFDSQKWKRLLAGVESWQLSDDASGMQASLMRVDAGRVMPRHTHTGRELTLILGGSMLDRDVTYCRGDVVEADETTRHRPRAGVGEDCVCLAVLEGDVVLTNPLYQFLSKILPSN